MGSVEMLLLWLGPLFVSLKILGVLVSVGCTMWIRPLLLNWDGWLLLNLMLLGLNTLWLNIWRIYTSLMWWSRLMHLGFSKVFLKLALLFLKAWFSWCVEGGLQIPGLILRSQVFHPLKLFSCILSLILILIVKSLTLWTPCWGAGIGLFWTPCSIIPVWIVFYLLLCRMVFFKTRSSESLRILVLSQLSLLTF